MLKKLKNTIQGILLGAQVTCLVIMLLVGFSDRLSPVTHPLLSCVGLTFPVLLAINVVFLLLWLLLRPKFALISVVGLIIGYSPIHTYIPFNIPATAPDSCIKVLSYNVANFRETAQDADGNNYVIATRYIRESGADIVCLQEAALNDVTAKLNDIYPYRDSVTTVHEKGNSTLVLLSKFPITGKEHIPYFSKGNSSCAFFVDINGTKTVVINNHLESCGLSASDRDEFRSIVKGETGRDTLRSGSKRILQILSESARRRGPQADSVCKYVVRHKPTPIILCGDFNDNPISYTHHVIAKELTDCFVSSGNGLGWSYAHYGMRVRIDNIFCSEDWEPYHCFVDKEAHGSDHFPILCTLKMKEKSKK